MDIKEKGSLIRGEGAEAQSSQDPTVLPIPGCSDPQVGAYHDPEGSPLKTEGVWAPAWGSAPGKGAPHNTWL